MRKKKPAVNPVETLFTLPENREHFKLFYKYLTQPPQPEGFILCQGLPGETRKIMSFFQSHPLHEKIYTINMADPVTDSMDLQRIIADVHDTPGNKKSVFFIHNFEGCIEKLKLEKSVFWERLNYVRDFFMRYNSTFVFFMTEALVKDMIRYAFDFYDWMRMIFLFAKEETSLESASVPMFDNQMGWYSNPDQKIKTISVRLEKTTDKYRRLPDLRILGELYFQVGEYEKALKVITEAVKLLEETPDNRNSELSTVYNLFSRIHLELGHYETALQIQEKVIKHQEEILNENDPNLANSYGNLSSIYRSFGQLDRALEFQLKSVHIAEKVLGPDHPSLATSYNNVSLIYQYLGHLDRALEFQLKALHIREKVLGPDHPSLATSYSNLSVIYQDMGQLDKSLEFQLKAVQIFEKVLGPDHPNLATSYNNLSKIYYEIGEHVKAISYSEKAVKIMEKLFPKGHPHLDDAMQTLSYVKSKH